MEGKRNTPPIALDIWKLFQGISLLQAHCAIDGTWTYDKYTQILLIAVMQDGNWNILLISFVIIEKEDIGS